jgi:pseudouridine-5'-phosphate glycosidase
VIHSEIVSEEVAATLAAGGPVVALESSIIAHGLPSPANREVAVALEEAVRERGAIPATIAIIDGAIRVGLEAGDIDRLAGEDDVAKANVADLAALMVKRRTAATTVSATSWIAAAAGISVFATGGIGGVHRGAPHDESSDLGTLARTPIAVVCAGPKSILDLERTAERLETLGVLLLGYRTGELPAFHSRTSGIALEHRIDSIAELAVILRTRFNVLGQGGVLIGNPIPTEAEIPLSELEPVIEAAELDASAAGIAGKALTPFLLGRLEEATGGRAVAANRALAVANAGVAAEIAVALARG